MTSGLKTTRAASPSARSGVIKRGLAPLALLAAAQLLAVGTADARTCSAITSTKDPSSTQVFAGALSSATRSAASGTRSTARPSASTAPACVVEVPNVVRLSPASARSRLAANRLKMSVSNSIEAKVTSERIARQTPRPGTRVACGCELAVVVAVPAAVTETDPVLQVTVPNVVGRGLKDAVRRLRDDPLSVRVTPPSRFNGVPGVVARQLPRGGSKVAVGSVVTLWLEPATTAVPSLVDRTPAAARKLAEGVGLELVVTERRRSTRRQDTVVAQSPRAGTRVPAGSRIAIEIELAQEMIRVPDVVKDEPEAALEALRAQRLKGRISERVQGAEDIDRVIGQSPAPGTWVPVNTTVRLAVAEARPLFPVPDVRGLAPAAAAARIASLRSARLGMQVLERRPSEAERDRVVRQRPAPGIRVPAGTVVEVGVDLARVAPPLIDAPTPGLADAKPVPPADEPIASAPERPLPPEVEPTAVESPVAETPLWQRLTEPLIRPVAIAFAALLLAFLLLTRLLRRLRRSRRRPGTEAAPAPMPRFVPHTDPGVQQIEMAAADSHLPEIRLQAHGDDGIQSLEIKQSDRFDEEKRYA